MTLGGVKESIMVLAVTWLCCALFVAAYAIAFPDRSRAQVPVDVAAMFAKAEAAGRAGLAKKTKLVDARPARPGEIVVTIIAGEGKETQSKPAEAGDMVVRNRCAETGHEMFLVKKGKFAERYEGPHGATGTDGWTPYRPKGVELKYFVVAAAEGAFTFDAPWGEAMVARPGDAIVQDPANPRDTYRVARASFTCTYEILAEPARR